MERFCLMEESKKTGAGNGVINLEIYDEKYVDELVVEDGR